MRSDRELARQRDTLERRSGMADAVVRLIQLWKMPGRAGGARGGGLGVCWGVGVCWGGDLCACPLFSPIASQWIMTKVAGGSLQSSL